MDLTSSGDNVRPEQESPPLMPAQPPPTGLPGELPESVGPAEPDAWESFVEPEAEGGEGVSAERPFAIAPGEENPWGFGPPPLESPPRRGLLSSILLIVLAVGLVAATAFGVWQYRQGIMARNAAQEAVALIGTGLPQELIPQASDIQADLTAGRPDVAAQKIAGLRATLDQLKAQPAGSTTGSGGTAPLPPDAYKELPGDAATFFQQHEDMYRRFLEMCAIARELKAKGANVDELRRMRDAVIEAARLGHPETVEEKMAVMLEQLKQQTGGGGGRLADKAHKVEQAAREAEARGRDVRAVVVLMRKTEAAAKTGNFAQAEKYLDQAMEAVRRAPQRPRDGQRPFMIGGGRVPRQNPLLPFVQTLLGVMGQEEQNLKIVMDQVLNIRAVLGGQAPAQAATTAPQPDSRIETLKPMAERALTELQTVAQRRQELTRAMQGRGIGKPPSRPRPWRDTTPGARETMLLRIAERLEAVMDRIRSLSDADYAQQKGALVGEIIQTVLRPPSPESAQPAQAPPVPQDPEQRVRARMVEASKVLQRWEVEGKDTRAIDTLFAEARRALYAKKFDVAEEKVAEARKLLGMDQGQAAEGAAAQPTPTPAVDPAAKIDLRGN